MVSKRHFLWIFSGVLLAAAGCQEDAVENALTCEPGLEICGQSCCAYTCIDNVCVNTKTDNNNCGEAGRVCTDSQVCTNGKCLSPEEACGTNQMWCKGDCVNIQSDANNCGDCGITCEENESCKDGSCFVGCSNGYTLCDGQCIDTKRDSEHCGGCAPENACVSNQICLDGNCVCPRGYYNCDGDISNGCESTTLCEYLCEDTEKVCGPDLCCEKEETCCGSSCCPANTMCCGDGVCADIINDAKNCGNCGITCEADEKCENGICVDNSNAQCEANPETGEIPEGDIICWNTCVHSLTDSANCGACGNVCDEGYACETGNCVKQCASADETACGDTCYNLKSDVQHCGDCDTACPSTQVCTDGTCTDAAVTCEDAAQTACWGTCANLQNDTANCGACGNVCEEGLSCVDGTCKLVCAKETEMVCNGVCVDVVSNPKACSDCGIQCATNQICVEGGCTDPETPVECGETMTNCWNTCVDITSDTQNCGGCGIVCGDTQTCTDGVCTDIPEEPDPNACDAPNLVCYGICTDVMNDDKNCGACLNACGNGEKCENGVCEIQCGELTKCGAACVDTHISSNHCGSCGVACKDGESCIGGDCQCTEGRYDCDGIASNGCESTRTCACTPGTKQNCWLGQADNRNQGACKDGTQVCDNSGQFWGQCTGGTYPSAITCNAAGQYLGGDQNCNGIDDTKEACVSQCDLMMAKDSYIGCEYWPVYMANNTPMNHTLVISNANSKEATIYVYRKADFTAAKPYKTVTVHPQSLAVIELSTGSTNMLSGTQLSEKAYMVRSTLPITAYQFNPWGSANAHTNDASLLLPTNVLGKHYIGMAWKVANSRGFGGSTFAAHLTVVATEDNTLVTITPKAQILAGGTVTTHNANETKTYTLNKFSSLNLTNATINADLTGTIITSTKNIAVYGGNICADIPNGYGACDHLEEQLFPTQVWGKSYLAVRTKPRGTAEDFWRILASENNTTITLPTTLVSSGKITLNAGQIYDLATTSSFIATADKPIMLGQFLAGKDYKNAGTGDPAFILNVPYEQYRKDYAFSVPSSYDFNYITVVKPKTAIITLDNSTVNTAGYTSIGKDFEFGYISIAPGNHFMTGTEGFGVYGYGFLGYTSYGYPIGLDLKRINNTN